MRKKFWLLAIFTSLCLIVLNLLFSPQPSSSLLVEDNSVFLGESLDYNSFLGSPVLHKDPDPAVTGVQIVGLDDLPAIKPMGCVRTKPILGVSPLVCIKPEQEDRFISDALLYEGIWEEGIVTNVIKASKLYEDAVFLDLGSNLGVYSLLVAQLRHSTGDQRPGRVVSVDAAGDNLAYISDVSEPLYPVPNFVDDPLTNPGSWQFVRKSDIGKREVLGPPTSSITMASLFNAIPPATLIVKMDIQGLECRALQTLGDFPASHPMPYIFMEWKELVASPRRCPNLVGFIDLMEAQGYSPRWPSKLALMPKHCLKGPSVDVLCVHKSAMPIWEESKDWTMDCAFHSNCIILATQQLLRG